MEERDVPLIAARLLTLLSGFYVLGGVGLQILGTVHSALNSSHSQPHHDAVVAHDLPLTSSNGETAPFNSVASVMWLGLYLPNVAYFLALRISVVIGMTVLVSSFVDSYRAVVDYVASVYALHVIVATAVCRFPSDLRWWLVLAIECAMVVVFSEVVVARKQRAAVTRSIRKLESDC